LYFVGGTGSTCDNAEMVLWRNYALSPAERLALQQNQRNYWMPAPLDSFTTPAAAYSLRRLKSTYAGPAIRVQRASDNAQQDINFLGFTGFTGAPLDVAQANAFCNATTCYIKTWYDQSGLGRDALDQGIPVLTDHPVLRFNCLGAQPCIRSGSAWMNSAATVTPATTSSVSVVGRVDSVPATCPFIQYGTQSLGSNASGDVWVMWNGGGLVPAALNGVPHAGAAVFAGAASVVRIDGTETTGTVPTTQTAGAIYVATNHDAVIRCSHFEAIWWDAYALTPAERAALVNNQKNFWGTP
jgi:hypothetical protein